MRRWALVLLVGGAGCGPEAGIYLTAAAPLQVPGACDGVHVLVTRNATAQAIYDRTYALDGSHQFPLTLTLVTSNRADVDSQGVAVEVDALLGGSPATPWASGQAAVVLVDHQLVPLTVALCANPGDAGCP